MSCAPLLQHGGLFSQALAFSLQNHPGDPAKRPLRRPTGERGIPRCASYHVQNSHTSGQSSTSCRTLPLSTHHTVQKLFYRHYAGLWRFDSEAHDPSSALYIYSHRRRCFRDPLLDAFDRFCPANVFDYQRFPIFCATSYSKKLTGNGTAGILAIPLTQKDTPTTDQQYGTLPLWLTPQAASY